MEGRKIILFLLLFYLSVTGAHKLNTNRTQIKTRKCLFCMHAEAFIEKKCRLKEEVWPRGLHAILSQSDKVWRSDNTKERGLGPKGWYTVGRWKWVKLMEGEDYFRRVFHQIQLWANFLSPGTVVVVLLLVWERRRNPFTNGNLCPV